MTRKTALLTLAVIVSNVAGNLALSGGMRRGVALEWVLLGVLLLSFWTLSRMTLLSWADLSYVLPVTSLGYVLTAIAGRVLLAEQISLSRWGGTFLITLGAILVGLTKPRTS